MANKGFFGPTDLLFGSQQRKPFPFTSRGNITGGGTNFFRGMGTDGAGTVLAVSAQGKVYKSVDGGKHWTLLSTIAGYTDTLDAYVIFGNGAWIITAGINPIAAGGHFFLSRSTDGGATWTSIDSNLIFPAGVLQGGLNLATDGAGTWVASTVGTTGNNVSVSTNNGVTWITSAPFPPASIGPTIFLDTSPMIWDGAQFIVTLYDGTVFPTVNAWISTSPNGVAWTSTSLTQGGDIFYSLSSHSGLYVAVGTNSDGSSGTSYAANTAAGLATAPRNLIPLLGGNTPTALLQGAGLYFATDNVGHIVASRTGTVWSAATSASAQNDGPQGQPTVCFDPVFRSFIIGSQSGFVETFP